MVAKSVRKLQAAAVSLAILLSLAGTARADLLGAIAKQEGVDPLLIWAVAMVESKRTFTEGAEKVVRPDNWVITVRGKAHRYNDRVEMAQALSRLLETEPLKDIDVGVMQINLHWQRDKYVNVYDLTDPVVNLVVGARVLKKAMDSTKDLELAIGRYHSWTPERARNYAKKVKCMRNQLGLYMAQNAAAPKKQSKENQNG